jgi:hypothetical protein
VSRALPESLAYARSQRAGRALVIGSPQTGDGEALVIDVVTGDERKVSIGELLEHPEALLAGAGTSSSGGAGAGSRRKR